MKKLKKGRKFSRKRNQRRALLNSLVNSFLDKGKIKTTEAKAKEVLRFSEKLITLAKKGDLASRRILQTRLSGKAAKKLIEEIAPAYKERQGGYGRVIKLGQRKTDGAKMAIIELVK